MIIYDLLSLLDYRYCSYYYWIDRNLNGAFEII